MIGLSDAVMSALTPAQVEALDDLEHNCDLINARPTAYDARWTLERAGASPEVCDAVWMAL